jgi:UDP-2-acetamido-3-amino-2,3-dideoxy-glucuronate N-acetyltransferase
MSQEEVRIPAAVEELSITKTGIGDSALFMLRQFIGPPGKLCPVEFPSEIPFIPQRYFLIYDVPPKEIRGEHAHKQCHQFLVCVRGSCCVSIDDAKSKQEIVLDRPNLGLYVPPMIWGAQYNYSKDAMLLVLASGQYERAEYVQSYSEFRSLLQGTP